MALNESFVIENTYRPENFIPPHEVTYNRHLQTIKIDEWEFSVEMLIMLMKLPVGTKLEKNAHNGFVFTSF